MTVRWYHWAAALIAGLAMHTAVFASIAWHRPTLIARSPGPQVIVFGHATDAAPAKTAPAKTAPAKTTAAKSKTPKPRDK